jgi:hypothetical protein
MYEALAAVTRYDLLCEQLEFTQAQESVLTETVLSLSRRWWALDYDEQSYGPNSEDDDYDEDAEEEWEEPDDYSVFSRSDIWARKRIVREAMGQGSRDRTQSQPKKRSEVRPEARERRPVKEASEKRRIVPTNISLNVSEASVVSSISSHRTASRPPVEPSSLRTPKGRQTEPVRRTGKDPVGEDEGFKVVGDRSRGKVTLQASAATPAKGLRASQKKGDRALGSDERGTRGRFESLSSQDEDDGDEEDDQDEEVQPAVVSEAEPEEEAGKTLTTSESVSFEECKISDYYSLELLPDFPLN